MANKFDLIVIGAGPSGATAAIYALREGLRVLLVDKEAVGGKLNVISSIQNYPTYSDISGQELSSRLLEQLKGLNVAFKLGEVRKVSKENMLFNVRIDKTSYSATAVIIATGTRDNKIGVPGETDFLGAGVSYCSLCDGPFFRRKDVAVIGAGDRAYSEAYYLSSIANRVYIIQRSTKPRADLLNINRIKSLNNVEILDNCELVSINGTNKVSSVSYKNKTTGQITQLEVKGVFPLIGSSPNSEIISAFSGSTTNGYVSVDGDLRTNTPGLFACGDVIAKSVRQIATSVGDGAIAGTMAARFVKELRE